MRKFEKIRYPLQAVDGKIKNKIGGMSAGILRGKIAIVENIMYTINDPMFALILRFAGRSQKVSFHNDEFIKRELNEIHAYIEQFPPEEQELRALEWVEAHAREYRKAWEGETVGGEVFHHRCPDCPFAVIEDPEHCEIHEEWLTLLERYTADELSSREYVENALELISKHKENLKIKLSAIKDARNEPRRE